MVDIEELAKKYKLSPEESKSIYLRIRDSIIGDKAREVRNCNYIFGQPGSGKSTFSYLLTTRKEDIALINGDFIRSFHPANDQLMRDYPNDYFHITYQDWNDWKKRIIADLVAGGYEFNLETACRNYESIAGDIESLRDNGYSIDVYVLAVSSIESRLRMLERFCMQISKEGIGRINDYALHESSYNNVLNVFSNINLDHVRNLYMVDHNLIQYPISKHCNQRELLISVMRNYNLRLTVEAFEERMSLIERAINLYRNTLGLSLNERADIQISKLKEDFKSR